jgi:hypothetical protein
LSLKRLIFRFYWAVGVIAFALAIYLTTTLAFNDRLPIIGAVTAGILGFCYFVQQQRLAETHLFKELFTEFNTRYNALNDRLAAIEGATVLSADQKCLIVDYFNLCAEEYLFYREGFILPEVWQSWCRGMSQYLDQEVFNKIWTEEVATESYYGLTEARIRQGAA